MPVQSNKLTRAGSGVCEALGDSPVLAGRHTLDPGAWLTVSSPLWSLYRPRTFTSRCANLAGSRYGRQPTGEATR